MPPKSRITAEMIIDAGFHIVRTAGIDALSVRAVSAQLNCSTQPVMQHFSTMDALKNEIYQKADAYHSAYLMNVDSESEDPLLGIGLRYIQFAAEEKYLFRFLFQSDKFASSTFSDLLNSDALAPIYSVLQQQADITWEQSHEAFASLFLAAQGFASLLANNSMAYNKAYCAMVLETIFTGVIGVMKGDLS